MKRIILLVLILTLALSATAFAGSTTLQTNHVSVKNDISLLLNGVPLEFDTPPQIIDGRTLVPVRKIFEALGTEISWVQETQNIKATNDDLVIDMWIGEKDLVYNNEKIKLDVAPQIINSRTYVPVRVIAELLNCEVYWDDENQTVLIIDQETNEKAKKLDVILNNSNFNSRVNLELTANMSNKDTRALESNFNMNFENSSKTVEEFLNNLSINMDAGYKSFDLEGEIEQFASILGTISTKKSELKNDKILLDLSFIMNDNGEEYKFMTQYPFSKEDIDMTNTMNIGDTTLLNIYLAPYIEIVEENNDTSYYIDSSDKLETLYTEELSPGEKLSFKLRFVDRDSDDKLNQIELIVDGRIMNQDDIFADLPLNKEIMGKAEYFGFDVTMKLMLE